MALMVAMIKPWWLSEEVEVVGEDAARDWPATRDLNSKHIALCNSIGIVTLEYTVDITT